MNFSIKIVSVIICQILFFNSLYSQKFDYKRSHIKTNLVLGFANHFDKPVSFPGNSQDYLTPELQLPRLGYQLNLSYLFSLNKNFSFGLNLNTSDYSFVERGNVALDFTGEIYPYITGRSFRMYGVGIITGYEIVSNSINKVTANFGFNYENFIATEGVYLWRETQNRTKFVTTFSVDYGHLITKNIHINIGLFTALSLNDFYTNIEYRPIRYGVSVGIEYSF